MEVQQDFKELLALLNKHEVEYLIVGAYALAFHGVPRFTGDLDVLVEPVPSNATKLMQALDEFGFGSTGLTAADFEQEGQVIQLGFPPVRIDILTSITGVSWDEARSSSVEGLLGNVTVRYIGKEAFVTNKRALGRKKDLADLEAVGED